MESTFMLPLTMWESQAEEVTEHGARVAGADLSGRRSSDGTAVGSVGPAVT